MFAVLDDEFSEVHQDNTTAYGLKDFMLFPEVIIYICEKRFQYLQTMQAPVIQTLDSTIYRINHYPADKCLGNQLRYPLDRDLSFG